MINRPGYLPEDEENVQEISETVELPVPGVEIDPAVLAARDERDRRVAQATLLEGITDIGSSLAGVKNDGRVYENYRKGADLVVDDASKDADRRSKSVSEYIRNQREEAKIADDKERWNAQLDYNRGRDEKNDKFNRDQLREQIAARLELGRMTADERKAARADKVEKEAKDDAEKKEKFTDTQAAAAGYGRRMEQAEADFDDLGKKGFDRSDTMSAIEDGAANLPWGIGDVVRGTVQSSESKLQEQAELNFLSAVLRRESGASISPSEREKGALQYFPRVGDTPEVIEQKKRNRQQAVASLKTSSGAAWDKTPGISGGGFPRKLKKGSKSVTVNSDAELAEAQAEGWQ